MRDKFSAVNTFQKATAVFGGSCVFGISVIPQTGVLQTVVFVRIFKSLCFYESIYFLHAFLVVVIFVQITDQLICGRIIADCDHFIEKMFGRVIHFQIAVLDFLHYGSHHIKFDQACGLLGTFVDAYHISGGQVFQINRPLGRIAVDASGKLCFQLFPGKILIQRIESVGRCKSGFLQNL